eukprot:UC4_evm8s506
MGTSDMLPGAEDSEYMDAACWTSDTYHRTLEGEPPAVSTVKLQQFYHHSVNEEISGISSASGHPASFFSSALGLTSAFLSNPLSKIPTSLGNLFATKNYSDVKPILPRCHPYDVPLAFVFNPRAFRDSNADSRQLPDRCKSCNALFDVANVPYGENKCFICGHISHNKVPRNFSRGTFINAYESTTPVKPHRSPVVFILIDEDLCSLDYAPTMQAIYDNLDRLSKSMIGRKFRVVIATYSQSLSLYQLGSAAKIACCDVYPFVKKAGQRWINKPKSLYECSWQTCREKVCDVLQNTFGARRSPHVWRCNPLHRTKCSMKFAIQFLEGTIGEKGEYSPEKGRLLIFSHLNARNLHKPSSNEFKNLGAWTRDKNVSMDLFVFSDKDQFGFTTLSSYATETDGQVKIYKSEDQNLRLKIDVAKALSNIFVPKSRLLIRHSSNVCLVASCINGIPREVTEDGIIEAPSGLYTLHILPVSNGSSTGLLRIQLELHQARMYDHGSRVLVCTSSCAPVTTEDSFLKSINHSVLSSVLLRAISSARNKFMSVHKDVQFSINEDPILIEALAALRGLGPALETKYLNWLQNFCKSPLYCNGESANAHSLRLEFLRGHLSWNVASEEPEFSHRILGNFSKYINSDVQDFMLTGTINGKGQTFTIQDKPNFSENIYQLENTAYFFQNSLEIFDRAGYEYYIVPSTEDAKFRLKNVSYKKASLIGPNSSQKKIRKEKTKCTRHVV